MIGPLQSLLGGSRTLEPVRGLSGRLSLPGDKSISHRSLLLGALCPGGCEVRGLLESADVLATAQSLSQLGARIERKGEDSLWVEGPSSGFSTSAEPLDCGNSGTSMRLLAGWLAGQGLGGRLVGDASLSRRPMARIVEPLSRMGASIRACGGGGRPPLELAPKSGLVGIDHRSLVASAQVKSALLLAGLGAEGPIRIVEPHRSRDHTERLLTWLGIELDVDAEGVGMRCGQGLGPAPGPIEVPGDLSAAAYFLVAAAIADEGQLHLEGVGLNPTRAGILDLLDGIGIAVTREAPAMMGPEPLADLCVASGEIRPFVIEGAIVPRLIDEIPVLGVLAARAEGTSVIRDAADLRAKESDRIATTAAMLRAFGVEVDEEPDGLRIHGRGRRTLAGGATVHAKGDHRIAMAAAVASTVAGSPTKVVGTDAVSTSFPAFFETLEGCSDR